MELTFFACHAKKLTKKNHRFLNLSRKSRSAFPPDSRNSVCEKQTSNRLESSHQFLLKALLFSSLNLKGGATTFELLLFFSRYKCETSYAKLNLK